MVTDVGTPTPSAAATPPAPRSKALLALVLLVPVPTLGVVLMLYVAPGPVGKVAAFCGKAWVALLPLLWWRLVDRRPLSFPRPGAKGLVAAIVTGVIILGAMLGVFELVRGDIDLEPLRANARKTGFDSPFTFWAMMGYIVVVNSLLEEYVWRWFVFRKLEEALPSGRGWSVWAVFGAAACFTLHHVFAIARWVDGYPVVLAILGVFVGGAIWSGLYLRYRSVWPGYVSHLCADVAVVILGWQLIFG